MKTSLLVIGKTKADYLIAGEQEYLKRLQRFRSIAYTILPELKKTNGLTEDEIKEKEGELLLQKFNTSDFVVLLDEKGKLFSSVDFSEWLEQAQHLGYKRLVFVIGGAYGFSKAVYEKAHFKISLSKMTFSHQMVRLLFLEQFYRAQTITANTPYHHE